MADVNDALIVTLENIRPRPTTAEIVLHLAVPIEHADRVQGFLAQIGKQFAVAFAAVEGQESTAKPVDSFVKQARILKASGFFLSPLVWEFAGSDESYQEYCRQRVCVICGGAGHYNEKTGEQRTEYSHLRITDASVDGRTSPSSAKKKPKYSGTPMCHKCHSRQHNNGIESLKQEVIRAGNPPVVILMKDWLQARRQAYLEGWAMWAIAGKMGFGSFEEIPPAQFLSVVLSNEHADDLMPLIPKQYR
jgi:hypothetical protein